MSTGKRRLPSHIGRFKVQKVLGSGAQGVVLLAIDEELARKVAVKVIRKSAGRTEIIRLASEAKIVSQLSHPNVVTLYEVGALKNLPYLVFEFIDGAPLRNELEANKQLGIAKSVIYMSQILGGVAHAHDNGVVHRDLSPLNILVTSEGVPKVMDFGLSTWGQLNQGGHSEELMGTLRYMAPEPLKGWKTGPHTDVFALGALLFEMLTGQFQLDGSNKAMLVDQILNGTTKLPSEFVDGIDPKIDEVVRKAMERDPANRYPDARAMKADLDKYRVPRGASASAEAERHSTVDFLLRRMNHRKGFSALSHNIAELLSMTSEDSQVGAGRLANVLAKDLTLTQRVLTAANSAFYGKNNITTVSRAIVLLGLQQVRMYVVNALLESQFEAGSAALRDALVASFFSGALSKELAPYMGLVKREDAFTAAVFHSLGRMLTIHYFPEEYEEISNLVDVQNMPELTASREVLGIPFHELATSVGESWKFPPQILKAMRPMPRGDLAPAIDEADRVYISAAFSNAVTDLFSVKTVSVERSMAELLERAGPAFVLTMDQLREAIANSTALAEKYARLLGIRQGKSPFLHALADARDQAERERAGEDVENSMEQTMQVPRRALSR